MPFFGERRQMACTRDDLRRWVGELLGAPAPAFVADRLNLRAAGVPLAIVVADVPVTSKASLRLALLEVRFEYDAADADAALAWMRRFDVQTQRGGG